MEYLILAIAVIAVGVYRLLQVGKRDKRLPPGPLTIPILGNAHQIPLTGLGKKLIFFYNLYLRFTDVYLLGSKHGQKNTVQFTR